MPFKSFWLLLLLSSTSLVFAQSLSLPSVSVTRGRKGSILLLLASSGDRRPVALQWDLLYPADELAIRPSDLVSGTAAREANKMLHCAVPPKEKHYRCILVGGEKLISDGPVAVISFRLYGRANVKTATIQIEKAIALSSKVEPLNLPTVEGKIVIERR